MRLLSTSAIAASSLALLSSNVEAAPTEKRSAAPERLHLKRNLGKRNDLADFALRQKAGIESRYGAGPQSAQRKRATGVATLSDYGLDSSYYATISTGTPSQSFEVIIDVRRRLDDTS